eukprot:TRINITY_DN26012_c0_g2_i1.p1 TRINITY_DN26012_c0_g2~~TRINITY_DN26012_c0_g2_i1.p1  ORF type:complete len:148 (+),score=0.81 TRINITY_DN26012_c0_g2_i1:238-681(+)
MIVSGSRCPSCISTKQKRPPYTRGSCPRNDRVQLLVSLLHLSFQITSGKEGASVKLPIAELSSVHLKCCLAADFTSATAFSSCVCETFCPLPLVVARVLPHSQLDLCKLRGETLLLEAHYPIQRMRRFLDPAGARYLDDDVRRHDPA